MRHGLGGGGEPHRRGGCGAEQSPSSMIHRTGIIIFEIAFVLFLLYKARNLLALEQPDIVLSKKVLLNLEDRARKMMNL